jgi:hypothetical protein
MGAAVGVAGAAVGAQALNSTANVIKVNANLRNIVSSPEKVSQSPCAPVIASEATPGGPPTRSAGHGQQSLFEPNRLLRRPAASSQ